MLRSITTSSVPPNRFGGTLDSYNDFNSGVLLSGLGLGRCASRRSSRCARLTSGRS